MLDINLLDEDIIEFITYVNVELLQGREMKDIEKNDFFVNDRVIEKRLARRKYKRIPNTANIVDINGNLIKIFSQEENGKISEVKPKEIAFKDEKSKFILLHDGKEMIYSQNIKSNELLELIERKEEIFKVLDCFKDMLGKEGDVDNELNIKLPNAEINEFRATIRINDVVWGKFKEFSKKYPKLTLKDITSQALIEFMDKYK